MLKVFIFLGLLHFVVSSYDEFDWRKTRPAELLAEIGEPPYDDTIEEDFELVKEPLIFRFDREWKSSAPNVNAGCRINKEMQTEMNSKDHSCFCYYSQGFGETDDEVGCGPDFAHFCSTAKFADFEVYTSGKLIVYRTGQTYDIPPFTVQEKISDDGNIVPMIRMKKVHDTCGLIYVENAYKQKQLHEIDEVATIWDKKSCPACSSGKCDAELDDGISSVSQ